MLTNLVLASLLSTQPALPDAPFGAYVEARTAAVYAGACHYGAQYTTQGREAVVGWSFEGGLFDGVALAGHSVAVILVGDKNLAEADAKVSSTVLLDASTSEAVRGAILGWLEATESELLGDKPTVRVAQAEVRVDGEDYRMRVVDGKRRVGLKGALLPERECCVMPYDRWYEPFASVTDSIVGCSDAFVLEEPNSKVRWSRVQENNAFVARFGRPIHLAQAAQPVR